MLIILILTIVTSIIVTLIITKNENNSTSSNHRNETKNIISIFGDNKNWRRKGLHNDKEFMVTVRMYFCLLYHPITQNHWIISAKLSSKLYAES